MAPFSRPRPESPQVITNAAAGRSIDRRRREVRYLVAMLVRVLCFVAAPFVPGWWKIVLIVVAVIVPSVAVMVANVHEERRAQLGEEYDATPENALGSTRDLPDWPVDPDRPDDPDDPTAEPGVRVIDTTAVETRPAIEPGPENRGGRP